jgi:hypothetical protein
MSKNPTTSEPKAARIAYLRELIADISERLKRPMDRMSRTLLDADRRDCRQELSQLTGEKAGMSAEQFYLGKKP